MNKILLPGEDTLPVWHNAEATYSQDDTTLEIKGKPVMERWETPFMHALATNAGSKGGRVLEVGFGMAICATKIQTFDITEHVIIECNDGVLARLLEWAKKMPHPVTPLKGTWQEVAQNLPDNTFDGIMYDTWAHSMEVLHTHTFEFIKCHGYQLLKPGGVLAYSNLMSWEAKMQEGYSDMQDMFEKTQVPHLLDAGFKRENIHAQVIPICPPDECQYYSLKQVIVPHLTK